MTLPVDVTFDAFDALEAPIDFEQAAEFLQENPGLFAQIWSWITLRKDLAFDTEKLELVRDIPAEKLELVKDIPTRIFEFIRDHGELIQDLIKKYEAAQRIDGTQLSDAVAKNVPLVVIAAFLATYSKTIADGYTTADPAQALHTAFRVIAPFDYTKPDEKPIFATKVLPAVGLATAAASLYFDVGKAYALPAAAAMMLPGIYNCVYRGLRDDIEIMRSIQRVFHRQFTALTNDLTQLNKACIGIQSSLDAIARSDTLEQATRHIKDFRMFYASLAGTLGSPTATSGLITHATRISAYITDLRYYAARQMRNIEDNGSQKAQTALSQLRIQLDSTNEILADTLAALRVTPCQLSPNGNSRKSALEHLNTLHLILPQFEDGSESFEALKEFCKTYRGSSDFQRIYRHIAALAAPVVAADAPDVPELARAAHLKQIITQAHSEHQSNVNYIQNWIMAAAAGIGAFAIYTGVKAGSSALKV